MILFDPEAMMAPLAARAASVQANGVPGVVVEVSRGGRVASMAVGEEDIRTHLPAVADQTFQVGSQTKMMTAVVLLQLADEGRIDLDSPAADWLPASMIAGIPHADTATVREIMAMRSGIPSYLEAIDPSGTPSYIKWMNDHPDQVFGPQQALDIARGMPASNPIGDFHYSNTAYLLLGLVIESVTGKAWAEVMQNRVFGPAGMTHSTAYTLAPDPQRWSSYDVSDGEYVDVTHVKWTPVGESGVVSTTDDLIAFMKALLVDGALLSDGALAEMTDFVKTNNSNAFQFGLGMFRQQVGGQTVDGFVGGTRGTESVTYYDPVNGTFVSLAGNTNDAGVSVEAKALDNAVNHLAVWAPINDDGGPLEIRSVSAAHLNILETGYGGVRLAYGGASVDLVRGLRSMDAAATVFDDGSVLVVGDGTASAGADDLRNVIHIAQMFPGAVAHDNQIFGLGGNDDLAGGRGNDRISGGLGDDALTGGGGRDKLYGGAGDDKIYGSRNPDRLFGGSGDDKLAGGSGHDRIVGGDGSDRLIGGTGLDRLTGGDGDDYFVFRSGDSGPGKADIIKDFHGGDVIGLRQIDAVEDDAKSAFHWVGTEAFTGTAGELRYEATARGVRVEGDTDGDGQADLAIALRSVHTLSADHFLL